MNLSRVLDLQRGHLFPWVPICLALGIGLYFSLPVEPGRAAYLAVAAGAVACLVCARRVGPALAPVPVALALLATGVGLAGWRSHTVAAPMLEFRYYGPVQGRLIAIDRSISDKPRLLFDRVVLSRVDPEDTPLRVRVSLHGDRSHDTALVPGKTLMLTAHLSAPRGPVEPGGFDFRRHAFFQQIGAVGYSRTPVMAVAPAEPGVWMFVQRVRSTLSEAVQTRLPEQRGAFAAAVLTGDRSGLSRETLDEMRATNLAHLLAISGLHMGLLTAVVFGLLRTAVAAIPPLALRVNSKKWAACGALVAATGYLAMSGGNVSTQRAFVMVSVMLCAILLDRRALSLRAVAIAACIILVLRPEALLGPGFQMSFAATVCLVWVFGHLRDRPRPDPDQPRPGKWRRRLRPVGALVISSAVAGLATAPVGMAHFNTSATYGLIANLMAVPLMGSLVMPAAVIAGALAPLGLEGPALWAMGQGIGAILLIADTIAQWPAAVRAVPKPPGGVLALLALGMLWLMLWRGRGRWGGAAPVLAALVLWITVPRPDVLISEDGKLVGVMGDAGRALSRERGNGFAARSWLENDGDLGTRADASGRWPTAARSRLGPARLAVAPALCGYAASATALAALMEDVPDGAWTCRPGAEQAKVGALAIWLRKDGTLRIATVRDGVGDRLWAPPEWRPKRDVPRRTGTQRADLQ